MKMSDVFDLPVRAQSFDVYSGATLENVDCEDAEACASFAVNNHDKLVELLEYFYKQPVDLMQVWPAGHIAKQNEAVALLKELGHEI